MIKNKQETISLHDSEVKAAITRYLMYNHNVNNEAIEEIKIMVDERNGLSSADITMKPEYEKIDPNEVIIPNKVKKVIPSKKNDELKPEDHIAFYWYGSIWEGVIKEIITMNNGEKDFSIKIDGKGFCRIKSTQLILYKNE